MNHTCHAQSRAGAISDMQASAHIHSDTHSHAVDKLEAIVRNFDPAAPDMVRTDIIQVLGDILGIWPVAVMEDRLQEHG